MTTAVLLSGETRTLAACWPSMQRHLFPHLGEIEFFAHMEPDGNEGALSLLGLKSQIVTSRQPCFPAYGLDGRRGRGASSVQAILGQLWHLEESDKLRLARQWETGRQFDWVVRLRPDTLFTSSIEDLAQCDPAACHVPTFFNFFGLNDRFAFGGPAVMEIYHRRLSWVDEYLSQPDTVFHPETMLAARLNGFPVNRTQVRFDTLRENGKRIEPRWNDGDAFGDILTCN